MSGEKPVDAASDEMRVTDAGVLFVDDEPNVLSSLRRLFRREGYRLFFTQDTDEALRLLDEESIDLVVSDHRMPGTTGIEFLKVVRQRHPEVMRVVLSGYTDIEAIVAAINEGQIYRFISKPWNDEELKITIRRCLETQAMARANADLTEQIRRQNEELRRFNEQLERKVEEKTEELLVRNRVLELVQEIFYDLPLGVAAVDLDGAVVAYNRRAEMLIPAADWSPGAQGEDVFPEEVIRMVRLAFEGQATDRPSQIAFAGGEYLVSCQPCGEPVKAAIIVGHSTCAWTAPA